MSGNVIDLCPVGALTNKPNAFSARSWEYRSTPSVDVLDPCAPSIKVDTAKGEVMRVQPRTNELVNEEWISDKTRFAVDGLKRQRLDMPLLRGANGALAPCTWQDALAAAAGALEGATRGRVGVVAGPLVELEALVALKDLFNKMGSTTTHSSGSAIGSADLRANYTLNATIAGIEDADAILLVGTNPRVEAPLVNTRIRKMVRHANVRVGLVGPEQTDLSYEYEALGASVSDLANVSKSDFGKHLASAKRPLILVGAGALERVDGAAIGSLARSLAITSGCLTDDGTDGGWNGYSVLQRSAGATGALDIGFTPGPTAVPISEVEVLYLAGADEPLPTSDKKPYVIYHGHHGDAGAAAADLVLPGAAYTEKAATYVSTEGRLNRTARALDPPGEAREDWTIVVALSRALKAPLPYSTSGAVRARLAEVAPHLEQGRIGEIEPSSGALAKLALEFESNGAADAKHGGGAPLASAVTNFYMSDPVSRASATMAKCAQVFGPRV